MDSRTNLERQTYAFYGSRKFNRGVYAVKKSEFIPKDSRILIMTPLMNNEGLLKVESQVEYYPGAREIFQLIVLESKHLVTRLLVKRYLFIKITIQ